jgi:hypothetical protein
MALSAREAFKVGFLSRCVEEQLTPAQMLERVQAANDLLEKRAFITGMLDKLYGLGEGVAKGLFMYGLPLALAAPPIIGGIGGYALSRATDIDYQDIEEVKNMELVEAYKRETEALRRRRAIKDYAKKKRKTGRVFP